MTKTLLIFSLILSAFCHAHEKIDEKYQVSFGDPAAPIKIIEYFSFSCPQCIRLYNKDFSQIKKQYIETNQIYWTFHPNPMDLPTIQAMACLEKLSSRQKQVFLEAMLSEAQGTTAHQLAVMMQKGLEILGSPLPDLEKIDYLKQTTAFQSAFAFVSQEKPITEVPTVEINGQVQEELPDKAFIDRKFKEISSKTQLSSLLTKGDRS